MEFFSDNFISYDNEFLSVKQEKANEHQHPTLDPFFTNDSVFSFPVSMPQTFQNILDNEDQTFTLDPPVYEDFAKDRKKTKPFSIIKTKKEEPLICSPESFEVKIESDDKLVTRTKRILKREKAKQRIKTKQEASVSVTCESSTAAAEVVDNPDLDDKTKKKVIQMIRNRISAQSSRDRKKIYMSQLEDVKSKLADENSKLNFEKEILLKELRKLEETQKKLVHENEALKRNAGHNTMAFESNSEEGSEDDCEGQEFSNIFKSIIGSSFGKMTGSNKKFYKSTLAFATMLSVIMMMNIMKQGGEIVQGGADWFKNSNLSGIQKKLLQNTELAEDLQELTEEISNSNENQFDFLDRLKPLLENLEAQQRRMSMDTQGDVTTGSPQSPPNIVKMEDLVQEDLLADNESLVLPPMTKRIVSIFGDEKMDLTVANYKSDLRIVGLNTVKYFGSKNGLIKFTQANDPAEVFRVKRENPQREDLFVKDEWHQQMIRTSFH